MTEFTYNNVKNANTDHIPFQLNCGYHFYVSYKEDINLRFKSKSVYKISTELRELMIIYKENLDHAQKLQKRANNKAVKLRSYAFGHKVWLNSQYIKTKLNCKLKFKFFGPFRVFHLVGNQAYKLKLAKKWKIYKVFHVSLLKNDIT